MVTYDGAPLRTFDLLPKLEREYGKAKTILAAKENGEWRVYTIEEALSENESRFWIPKKSMVQE